MARGSADAPGHNGCPGGDRCLRAVQVEHDQKRRSFSHGLSLYMARVAGLMKLATSSDGELRLTGFMTYEGVGADIFRLIVVFLHATVEYLVRSQLPAKRQFSFQSGTDIDKALRRAGFDSSCQSRSIVH